MNSLKEFRARTFQSCLTPTISVWSSYSAAYVEEEEYCPRHSSARKRW
jgi:hypothetical protein